MPSIALRTSSATRDVPPSSPAAAARSARPIWIVHFVGTGSKPSGPNHGNVGVIGYIRDAERLGEARDLSDHRVDLLGADDRDRQQRHLRLAGEPHEAAAAEAREPIALPIQLADALETFRETRRPARRAPASAARSPLRRGRNRRAQRRWPSSPNETRSSRPAGARGDGGDVRGGRRAAASRRHRGCRPNGCRPAARRRRRGRCPRPAAGRGSSASRGTPAAAPCVRRSAGS